MNEPIGNTLIEGKWYNKQTGRTITVRDSFMDGEDMQIITTEGDLISGDDFTKYYIQTSDNVYDESGNITGTETINYDNMFVDEKPSYDYTEPSIQVQTTYTEQDKKESDKKTLLEDIFENFETKPKINITVDWDDKSIHEFNILKKYLNFSIDDIVDYVCDTINTEETKETINKTIYKMLNHE